MTDQIDYRKGRNLSALSFLIIVYTLSGAELQNQGMMLGVVLTIEHTEIISYAVTALFGFSAYQFGIETRNPNHRTLQTIYDYLCTDKKLQKHVTARGQDALDKADTKEKLSGLIGKSTSQPTKERSARWYSPKKDPHTGKREKPTTKRSLTRVTVTVNAKERPSGTGYGNFEVDIDPVFYYARELRALFFSVFYHAEAWEDIFPLILALWAFILILRNWAGA